jgi:lipoprotein-anchoring transpeptidase ErfK/SrfK
LIGFPLPVSGGAGVGNKIKKSGSPLFFNSYLFHSTPFDKDGNIILEDRLNIGKPASHGCIRLDVEDAKWFYESIPSGVTVNIY